MVRKLTVFCNILNIFSFFYLILTDLISVKHPVHIIKKDEEFSPSAFIPFCEFGGNMDAVGRKINQFNITVCNSFQPKLTYDQLCYEIDLNGFSKKDNNEKELNLGFVFIMDYNEDRQVTYNKKKKKNQRNKVISLTERIVQFQDVNDASIYLNTIGRTISFSFICDMCKLD